MKSTKADRNREPPIALGRLRKARATPTSSRFRSVRTSSCLNSPFFGCLGRLPRSVTWTVWIAQSNPNLVGQNRRSRRTVRPQRRARTNPRSCLSRVGTAYLAPVRGCGSPWGLLAWKRPQSSRAVRRRRVPRSPKWQTPGGTPTRRSLLLAEKSEGRDQEFGGWSNTSRDYSRCSALGY